MVSRRQTRRLNLTQAHNVFSSKIPSYRLRDGDGVKQIIGVVSDVKHTDLSSDAEPEIY